MDYIGEAISVTSHSVQGFMVAREEGQSEEVQIAAFLHDIGHLLGFEAGFSPGMDGCGTMDHEGVGAEFLKGMGFSDNIGYLVKAHVDAKRYLCWKDKSYYDKLTDASKTTLKFQGGPMSDEEGHAFESDPRYELSLKMREYDEIAKSPDMVMDPWQSFMPAIRNHLKQQAGGALDHYHLSSEQLRRWDEDGFLHIKGAIPQHYVDQLSAIADNLTKVDRSPSSPFLVHYEQTDKEKNICRVENFCKNVPEWEHICFDIVQGLVDQVYREPSVLFKDKLNYKGPGGAGFHCHQDATAYATEDLASRHVSAMVAIDSSSTENGCLQVAAGLHKQGVIDHIEGVTRPEIENGMNFINVLVKPGDIVLFDSYLPHRSAANNTNTWRRLAYLTFNPLSEGDLHAAYYTKKRELMKTGAISLNLDFAGRIVD